ncbi:MAG: hypothetical protein ABSH36_04005 [Solirubrobacteraceae bacterium]
MPQRPIRSLAVVGVLAIGDYLLWNWSVGANYDVIALVAGVTLIPLLIALAWLVVVATARLLAHAAHRPRATSAAEPHRALGDPTPATATVAAGRTGSESTAASPSSKLAA